MTKEEKIKEAYISEFTNKEQDFDDRFEFLKPYIDEYGWLCGKLHDVDMNKFDVSGHEIRPKSLSGIENNNGWTKIESEEDLPENGYYEVIKRLNGFASRATLDKEFGQKRQLLNYSHYQKIVELPKPIF